MNRVLRGGSWNNNAENCRVANRNNNNPNNENNNYGFRLANTASVREGCFLRKVAQRGCCPALDPAFRQGAVEIEYNPTLTRLVACCAGKNGVEFLFFTEWVALLVMTLGMSWCVGG